MVTRTAISALLATAALTAAACIAALAPAVAVTPAPPAVTHTYGYNTGNGTNIYAYWTGWDPSRKRVPWIINVHGGYWGYANHPGYTPYQGTHNTWAQGEQARGVAAFVINYRQLPGATWPTPETDVQAAVAWVRSHADLFGLDLHEGFILGGSAGGILATDAALNMGGFAGVISMAGVNDVYAAYRDKAQTNPTLKAAALALEAGVKPWQDYRPWADARAQNHLLKTPRQPFLLVHSIHDPTVNIKMSDDFRAELRTDRYRVWDYRLPGVTHILTRPSDYALVDHWVDSILNGSIH